MRRSSLLLLVPVLLVGSVVAATVYRLRQDPNAGQIAPELAVQSEALGDLRFEIEYRPGSESFEVVRAADALSVRRGGDRFEYSHGIPLVNGTTFPSPAAGETVRWNLDGPLVVGGRPVEPHRFQPRRLDAPPTELLWDIKNPSDAPRDSLSADWSRVGRVLVTAHGDGVLRVWDVEKKTVRTEITPLAPTDGRKRWGFKAAVSPDGKTVAAANVHTPVVTLWEADTGKPIATLTDPIGNVTDLKFLADGRLTEARSGDYYVRDLSGDRTKLVEFGWAPNDIRVTSPVTVDVLAVANDVSPLRLETPAGSRRLWWRSRPDGQAVPIAALAFFTDGKTLAVGAADGLRLYDVESGRERGWVTTLSIRSLAVSGDGAYLAASMEHGPAVLLWRAAELQPR